MPKHNALEFYGESITTPGATVTDIVTINTKPSKAYSVRVFVVALNQDLTQAAVFERMAGFRTDAAGVLTQVGVTSSTPTPIKDNAAWDVTLDTSGTDIRVRATGAAATNINWRADAGVNTVGIGPENS